MLPLGSIVLLKEAKKGAYLMIVGRYPLAERDGVKGYYDYIACKSYFGVTEKNFFILMPKILQM